MATEPDFSAIGTDVVATASPTDMARREEQAFALERAKEDHEHLIKVKQHELGAVGRVFGSRDNAITYVVAAIVVISLFAIGVFSFMEAKGASSAVEFFKSIAFAGFGYLTGKSLEAK